MKPEAKKILIVEDTLSIRELLRSVLEAEGYQVGTAEDGRGGIETAMIFKPDLALLDVVMPGIDGYDVCRALREKPDLGFLKIIMVSSQTLLGERLKGYEAGADDYIRKPFEKAELLAKVKVFLRLKSTEDQLRELNASLNEQVRIRTRQLLDSEKMAALGRHAAGVVHNLNNPLNVLMSSAEILMLKYPDEKFVKMQRKATAQMSRTIRTILTSSHRESTEDMSLLNMNKILRDQVELLQANPFFKHEVNVEMELGDLPVYRGVYAHFSQSFGNLLKNAIDAMYDRDEKRLTIYSAEKDSAIVIRISDTGCGIPEHHFEKIFDPFYTTKPLSAPRDRPAGTGLGLASCREMINAYGGIISVISKPDLGTTFTVRLPLEGGEPAAVLKT